MFLMLIQKDLETWGAWCWVRTQAVGAEELTPVSAPVTLGGSQLHVVVNASFGASDARERVDRMTL